MSLFDSQGNLQSESQQNIDGGPVQSYMNFDKKARGFIGGTMTGFLKGIASTVSSASGIGQRMLRGITSFSSGGKVTRDMQPIASLPSSMTEANGAGQRIGKFIEQGAELMTPVGGAEKAAVGIADKSSMIAKTLRAIGDAAEWFGKTYLQTGSPKQAAIAGATAGVLNVGGSIASSAWNAIKGDFTSSLGRAFGAGKGDITTVLKSPEKAASAMKIMNNMKEDLMVGSEDSLHAFDPSRATWTETAQALVGAKQKIYDAYSSAAKAAGDSGANFSQADWTKIITKLTNFGKDTNPSIRSAAEKWIQYLKENFGTLNIRDGKYYMSNTEFTRIQSFLESGINKGLNWNSDAAGATVSKELSGLIRSVMDEKISSSTGVGYQELRNSYSDLKSIEDAVKSQLKKAIAAGGKKTTGVGKWMERFGTVEAIAGILTHGTSEALRGLGLVGVAELNRYLRSSETALRTAFSLLDNPARQVSPGVGRTMLKAGMTGATRNISNIGGPTQ